MGLVMTMNDDERCEWPFPQCEALATAWMTYGTPDRDIGTKVLCGEHFRAVEAILWARGLTWTSEPTRVSRLVLAHKAKALADESRNRTGEVE